MKLMIVLMLVCYMQISAKSVSQNVTLKVRDAPLTKVFREIKKQTGYTFIYTESMLREAKRVSIKVSNATLREVLDICFAERPFSYRIIDETVVVEVAKTEGIAIVAGNFLSPASVSPPPVEIKGRVTDENGNPLAGVSVVLKGSSIGTTTNENGEYSLSLESGNGVLVFSSVGHTSQEIPINRKAMVNATLQTSTSAMEDVVVIGYGNKANKATLTSAISATKGNALVEAVPNVANKLSGRVPGILSYQSSGEPGLDETTIRIRGINTLGNASPLVIIDGVPGKMSDINSEDIDDISILKDAAAAAPYGLAAANGVILITTKQGIKGTKARISYNGNYGIQNPVWLTRTFNSYQMALMQNEIYLNDHPGDLNVPWSDYDLEQFHKVVTKDPTAEYSKYFNSHNLFDVIRHDYPMSNHNLSIRGGGDNVTYYAGLGYFDQASMIPNEDFKKYSGVFNLNANLNKTLKAFLSVRMIQNNRIWPSFGGQITNQFGIYGRMYEISPDDAIWYPSTPGYWAKGKFEFNPVGRIYTSGLSHDNDNEAVYNFGLEQKLPLKGLSIKGIFNYSVRNTFDEAWTKAPTYYDVDNTVQPAVYIKREPTSKPVFEQSYWRSNQITAQGYINFDRTFGQHTVSALFVTEVRDIVNKAFSASRRNYSVPIQTLNFGSSNQADLGNSGTGSEDRQIGVVVKVDYRYKNKYMLGFSGRRDQHYYFAPGFRTGYFPAISAGWRIGEEKFVKNEYSWINELKIRGSWGQSGNLAGGPFQYLSTYGIESEIYRLGGQLGSGLFELSPANPFITWEKQNQTDFGLDFTLWNGLLSFSGDYFYQVRSNMLVTPDVITPAEYGIALPEENAGKMSNSGVELSLNTRNDLTNGITFGIAANFTYAKNKLLNTFENPATFNDPNRRRTGNELGAQYGLVALGYFQSQEEIDHSPKQNLGFYTVGDVKYADLNGDGVIDATDERKIGYPNFPEIIFGLNLDFSWKGFDLSALIQGATKMSVNRPGAAGGGAPGNSNGNTQIEALDHWTPQTPNAKFPRWSYLSIPNNFKTSTLTMRDNTYIRLKGFSLGYTIPRSILNRIKIESLRFYITGQNFFSWTVEYLNSDPESAAGGAYRFANQKSLSVGASLAF